MKTTLSQVSRRTMLFGVAGAAGTAALIGGATGIMSSSAELAGRGEATLYKNPECGCCEAYADYLRGNGFAVKLIPSNDLLVMGQKYGIPDADAPCHISLIGGYVVGGHMPFEIVNRLLAEKPQITGINLPGMPTGTPGMLGRKTRLTIYEIGKGPKKVYAVV
ncbi:MAG: DUF411 domain-containing protein [Thiohalocapsa sp.]